MQSKTGQTLDLNNTLKLKAKQIGFSHKNSVAQIGKPKYSENFFRASSIGDIYKFKNTVQKQKLNNESSQNIGIGNFTKLNVGSNTGASGSLAESPRASARGLAHPHYGTLQIIRDSS